MGKIKTIFERIKTKISSEELAKIESDISEGIAEDEKLYTQLADTRRESAERRERVQELQSDNDKLRAKTTDLQAEIEKGKDPKNDAELKRLQGIETQFQQLQTEAEKKLRDQWADKSKVLSVDKSSKIFDKIEKVKGRFVFPEANADLPIDVVKRNLETYELLETTGYFTADTSYAGGRAPGTNPKTDIQKVNPFEGKFKS
jgi:predicted nuclease with TOPRIM domain